DLIPGGFQITSVSTLLLPADPRTRAFSSFSQVLAEITEARIWAGLHYRTADVQGRQLGQNVANYAAAHFFEAVGKAQQRFMPKGDPRSSRALISAPGIGRSLDTMKRRLLFLILIVGLLTLAVGGWTVQGMRRAFALPQPA